VAIARGNAADVLGRLGRIDAAVPAFEAARRACEANGAHLDAARLSCEEAEMLWHAGALRAARDRYADALVPLEREGAGADLARARVALAGVLVELGDARSAAEIVKAASAGAGVGASSGARQDDATAFAASIVLARSALAVGDVARGRALVDAARGGADADLPARRARACLLSSRIALAEGDATRATEEARAALDAASATPLPGLIPDCHEALGVCALAMGEGAMAVRHLGLACDAAERAMEATASVAGHAGLVRRFAPMFVRHASLLLDAGATIEDAARAIVRAGLRALPRRAGGGMVRAGGGRGGGGRGGGGVAGVMAADADLRARLERVSTALDRATAAAGAFPRAEQARDIAGLLAHAAVLRERLATPESAVDGPDARAGEEARAGADAGRAALSGPEARSAEARGAEAAGQGVRDASRVCAAVARLARAHGTDAALLHWFVEEGAGGPWLSVLGAAARAEGAERSGEAGAGARDQPRLWIVRRVLTTADLASRVKRLAFLAERAATAVVGVGAAGAVQPAPEAWDLVLGRLARDVLAKALPDVAGTDAATPGLLVISGDRGVQPIPWMALARACWPGGAGGMGAAVPTRVVLEDLDRVLAAETGSDSAAAVRSSPRVCILAADDASIPGARAEALAVAAAWADARVVVGGTATVWLDAIRGEALPRTDQGHSSMATAPTILHIATHGVYVPDRPLASRLWCGDAWRTVGEIAAAIPSGAIVTLSVCHAGRAGGFAEDVAALPAALRAGGGVGAGGGGAACVVAPLWPLADATATRLFADIHAACARAYRAAASSLAASGAADEAKSPSDYPGSGRNLGIGGAVSVPALVASAVASMLGQGRVDTRWSIDGDGVVVNGAGP
jgi:tetratricopeptide (TPR) repeat protein